MVPWTPLYLSIGIIISLVVGAPLCWFFNRRSRRRLNTLKNKELELKRLRSDLAGKRNLEDLLQQETSSHRRVLDERNDLSTQVRMQLSGYRECQTNLASSEERVRNLERESSSKDQQHERIVQDIQAAAESRLNELKEEHANLLKKHNFVIQRYRALQEES